jgi:hypothetical protein
MKRKEEHPKEITKINLILGYAEEHEEEEQENTGDNETKEDDEADSSHYSIGGDNGL